MLNKQVVSINFSQGLNTKTDPFQVPPGQFLALENSVFNKGGQLQKRSGFGTLTALPDTSNTYATTFNGNLLAIGDTLNAYSAGAESWVNKGNILPINLSTISLYNSNTNQTQMDTAISSTGLVCTVFTDQLPNGASTTPSYKYIIADASTGQNVVAPTVIPVASGTVTGSARVFTLGNYFVIVFSNVITATDHLQYVAISTINPTRVTANVDISSNYRKASSVSFDGVVANNNLYIAWTDGSGNIRMTFIDSTLTSHGTSTFVAAHSNTIVAMCADVTGTTPVIYCTGYDPISTTAYTLAVDHSMNTVHAFTQTITGKAVLNITQTAQNSLCTILYEVINNPAYDGSVPADYINKVTITQAGSVGSTSTILRGVGLASKAFIYNSNIYALALYSSIYQPTYFLTDSNGNISAKLAYSNGASSYYSTGLPSCTLSGSTAKISYLFKDQIQAVNKTQGATTATGIYTQTGINLAQFELGVSALSTAEIGKNLLLSGGFMWAYDGFTPVEQNFHLWPDYVEATGSSTSGAMLAQKYFYVATYEWTDFQGNIFRSAPSIPIQVDLSAAAPSGISFTSAFAAGQTTITVSSTAGLQVGQVITDTTTGANIAAGTTITAIGVGTITISIPAVHNSAAGPGDTLKTVTTCSATVYVPTLRLTYKTATPVKIVLYRWSIAQQTYYQTTSLMSPVLNDTSVDYVTITDTQPDASIVGNNILYTTGGVVEDIAPPATNLITLFQDRLFLVDAEDENLLWFSKQVIESTPVEMSDLLTIYVAPTIGSQGSTGGVTSLSSMDDKLIIFKRNAIYYITGQGPNNTGADNGFSDPVYITGTVGCANQQSIVLMPNGLMFQSDKGIWLLDRGLSTNYIGAPVEAFTQSNRVLSAVSIPGTNQVRFTLDSGVTLMYDYYYQQWGTFTGIPAVSSTLYDGLHTYINDLGQVYQETPGVYLDGSRPVLLNFTTSWLHLAGLQGYQRAYFFYLLATYQSPHKLQLQIAYDYNSSPSQSVVISPTNYAAPWGGEQLWGSGEFWGGQPQLEQWRVFFQTQKCQAFQITLSELFDSSFSTVAGAGFTMSGLDVVVGTKKGYRPIRAANSVG